MYQFKPRTINNNFYLNHEKGDMIFSSQTAERSTTLSTRYFFCTYNWKGECTQASALRGRLLCWGGRGLLSADQWQPVITLQNWRSKKYNDRVQWQWRPGGCLALTDPHTGSSVLSLGPWLRHRQAEHHWLSWRTPRAHLLKTWKPSQYWMALRYVQTQSLEVLLNFNELRFSLLGMQLLYWFHNWWMNNEWILSISKIP